jgi:hypothetical protein
MNSMFEVSGILTLIGVVGIVGSQPRGARHLRMLLVLLALPALGSMMDGVFTLRYEFMHSQGFVLALASMVAIPVAGRLLRQSPPWHEFGNWLFVAGPLTLFLALLFLASVTPSIRHGTAGLTERILVVEIASWYVALGWWAFARRVPIGPGTHRLGATMATRWCRSAEGIGSGPPGPHGVLGPHKF